MRKSVIKATGIVFLLSLVAKIIGFIKSMVEASFFGASIEMDAFNVTSGFVGNILYMFTTAIAVAFIPIYIQRKNDDERRKFATRTITILCLCSLVLVGVLLLTSNLIIRLIAPAFNVEQQKLAASFFRILVVGITFSLMANMFTSVLNAEKRYGYSSLSSLFNSVILILFIIAFSKRLGVWSLVLAMPISFFVQWLALYIVGHNYALISFKYGIKEENIRVLLVQAAPILLAQATVEINQVVDRALLSGVAVGALTAVSYSAVLFQFVTALISMPISTVMFTELSEAGVNKEHQKIKSILDESSKIIVLLSLPIIVITILCSEDIVSFVYGHGKFDSIAVKQCATGLKMYIFCLLPVSIKAVLSRAYYGLNDTKHPMYMGVLEVAFNILLSVLLVKKYGILGVVGATAVASYVFIIVMFIDYSKRYINLIVKDTILSYWKIILSLAVMIIVLLIIYPLISLSHLFSFLLIASVGLIIYILLLLLMKERTIIQFLSAIKKISHK